MSDTIDYDILSLLWPGQGADFIIHAVRLYVPHKYLVDGEKTTTRFNGDGAAHEGSKTYDEELRLHRKQASRLYRFNSIRPYDDDTEPAWWADTSFADEAWYHDIPDMFGDSGNASKATTVVPEAAHARKTKRKREAEEDLPVQVDATQDDEELARQLSFELNYGSRRKRVKQTEPRPAIRPIPQHIQALADYINNLPRNPRGRKDSTFPSRNTLKTDDRLNGEINRKTGCLRIVKRKGQLRLFEGDERLFSKDMWAYLTTEGIPDGE